jgi:hypothetical protein
VKIVAKVYTRSESSGNIVTEMRMFFSVKQKASRRRVVVSSSSCFTAHVLLFDLALSFPGASIASYLVKYKVFRMTMNEDWCHVQGRVRVHM